MYNCSEGGRQEGGTINILWIFFHWKVQLSSHFVPLGQEFFIGSSLEV